MPSILASQLTNSKITMAMKVSLFFSLMVATLAIPISGVQAFFFFFFVKVESRPWVMIFSSTALCIAQAAEV